MDELLTGGFTNVGAVFRRGGEVERPASPFSPGIHRFLGALADGGFDGAPRPIALDGDGRERLTFLTGDVAHSPYPAWSLTEAALASVGALLRRLHDASSRIPVDPAVEWARDLADPRGGTMICHNDACQENVVFREGEAAALIDFDFAAPGRPLWDVAMSARYWAPVLDPETATFSGQEGLDPVRRLRIFADGYRMSRAERAEFPTVIEEVTAVDRAFLAARVAAGDAPFVKAFTEHGGWAMWDRLQGWIAGNRQTFLDALLDGFEEPAP